MQKYFVKSLATGQVYSTDNLTMWGSDFEPMSAKDGKALYLEQVKASLRETLKGATCGGKIIIYGIVINVSASGMSRSVKLLCTGDNARVFNITRMASDIMGWRLDKRGNMIVRGCGMNMVDHAIDSLGYILDGHDHNLVSGNL
jgi:hypothetical protein